MYGVASVISGVILWRVKLEIVLFIENILWSLTFSLSDPVPDVEGILSNSTDPWCGDVTLIFGDDSAKVILGRFRAWID